MIENVPSVETVLIILCTLAGVIGIVIGIIARSIEGPSETAAGRRIERWLLAAAGVAISSWLWIPWACYVVRNINRANLAVINDLERQEIVLPPADRIRPSAADLPVDQVDDHEQGDAAPEEEPRGP